MDSVIINSNYSAVDVAKRTDALQAVKLDPAVLEVKITDTQHRPATGTDEAHVEVNTFKECRVSPKFKFEDMLKMQKAALLSMPPQQLEILLKYAEMLRIQRIGQKQLECAFCKNNGESASWYSLHKLKDSRGRVRCPVLRGYRCRCCGATGDFAHTIKYCPQTDRPDRWSC